MIVVADTSVILNLCRVQQERLLQRLFKRVLIPAQVADEFERLSKVQQRFSGLLTDDTVQDAEFTVQKKAPSVKGRKR